MLCRIWKNGFNEQMMVTIPKNNEHNLSAGMYVTVMPAQPPVLNKKCKVCGRDYKEHTLEELVKHGLWVK